MRPVLIIITSNECPACKDYKTNESKKLERLLQVDARVHVVKLESHPDIVNKRITYSGAKRYHQELKDKYPCWLPNFILCTMADWQNDEGPLNGIIYGGELKKENENGKIIDVVKEIEGEYIVRAENIMNWIVEKLNTPKFKNKSIIKYKEYVEKKRYPYR